MNATDTYDIYKIICLINNKFYIGSSININKRLKAHVNLLKRNKHPNKRLQNAWDECGEKNFKFEIIETVYDINQLLIREKWWIDTTNCCNRKIGFNISHDPHKINNGRFIDLTGQKFGELTVDKYMGQSKWLCRCDCGKEKIVLCCNLRNGNTKSCGCKEGNLKHGHSQTKIYNIWRDMNQRCNNKNNKGYKNYGKRKIKVCYRWSNKNPRGFENFYKDVGDPPKGKSINRINNSVGYFSNNWRWATSAQINRNMRSNRNYFLNNKKQCLVDIAKEYDIHINTLRHRLDKLGLSIEEAITRPIDKRYSHGKRG